MNPTIVTRKKPEQGQALIEFALTLPVLLLVIYAIIAFAVLFYSYLTMQLAVREGTNSIVHNPQQTVAAVQNTVLGAMVTLDRNNVTVTVEPSNPNSWISGVQVSVSAVYNVILPVAVLGSIPFRATSVMTIE